MNLIDVGSNYFANFIFLSSGTTKNFSNNSLNYKNYLEDRQASAWDYSSLSPQNHKIDPKWLICQWTLTKSSNVTSSVPKSKQSVEARKTESANICSAQFVNSENFLFTRQLFIIFCEERKQIARL